MGRPEAMLQARVEARRVGPGRPLILFGCDEDNGSLDFLAASEGCIHRASLL